MRRRDLDPLIDISFIDRDPVLIKVMIRFIVILLVAALVQSCSRDELDSIDASGNRIKSYGPLKEYPSNVLSVMKHLEGVPARSSMKEFVSGLRDAGVVEVPSEHFKDWEHYWVIKPDGEESPSFILAGAFFPYENSELMYATISWVEDPGGIWRTVWSIEYDPDPETELATPLIIRD